MTILKVKRSTQEFPKLRSLRLGIRPVSSIIRCACDCYSNALRYALRRTPHHFARKPKLSREQNAYTKVYIFRPITINSALAVLQLY